MLHAPSKPGRDADLEPVRNARRGQGGVRGELETVEGVGGDGGSRLTIRAQCGRSLVYSLSGNPFGIGYFEVGMVQVQLVRQV